MEIKKVPTQYETRYIANDGKEWTTKTQCQQYEELLSDPTPLKNLRFYNKKGERIDVFALHRIPDFSYLVLENSVPKYDWEIVRKIIGDNGGSDSTYRLPSADGIWFNDWSNAYSGSFGANGWVREESIEILEYRIETYQEKIELFKKIRQTS